MPMLDVEQRRVVGAFGPSALRRLAVTLRLATCPARRIVDAIAPDARVLDVGCGWGALALLAATTGPGRRVTGVDVDATRVGAAERAAGRIGVTDRVTFRQLDTADAPESGSPGSEDVGQGANTDRDPGALFGGAGLGSEGSEVDTVLIVDVLYLLGVERSESLLRAACRTVGPGGRVVVKEMADSPRWKVRLTLAQEFLATGVTGYTTGRVAGLVPIPAIVATLESAGARVRVERVDRWDLHPHVLVVADLPTR